MKSNLFLKLSGFGTLWLCEYFSIANFRKSKYRSSISNDNLNSKLKWAINIKYTPDFKN
jgi:hypothetical protein